MEEGNGTARCVKTFHLRIRNASWSGMAFSKSRKVEYLKLLMAVLEIALSSQSTDVWASGRTGDRGVVLALNGAPGTVLSVGPEYGMGWMWGLQG